MGYECLPGEAARTGGDILVRQLENQITVENAEKISAGKMSPKPNPVNKLKADPLVQQYPGHPGYLASAGGGLFSRRGQYELLLKQMRCSEVGCTCAASSHVVSLRFPLVPPRAAVISVDR
jgi:hypothetical protein